MEVTIATNGKQVAYLSGEFCFRLTDQVHQEIPTVEKIVVLPLGTCVIETHM